MKKTRKLRVLQLLPSLNAGGVERGTLEISRALVEAGHESIVVSAGGQLTKELFAHGAEHIELAIGKKSLSVIFLIWPLRNILMMNNVDIVHVRSRLPAWLLHLTMMFIPTNTRPKIVSTVHGLYSVSKYSEIMTKGDKIIAVSNTTEKYIHDNYPSCPKNKIAVIPRGVSQVEFSVDYKPPEDWKTSFFAQFPEAENKILLTLPGRLTRLKGHRKFIKLIDELRSKNINVHGLIVGAEDPRRRGYANEIKAFIHQRKLSIAISLTGNRNDITDIYSISSIVFSLSEKPESFGRTVAEALNMSTPVVALKHGGAGELLKEAYPAGLVPLDIGASELAVKVIAILESVPDINIKSIPTLDDMTSKTINLYRNVVGS